MKIHMQGMGEFDHFLHTDDWKAQHSSSSPYLQFDMFCNGKNRVIYSLTSQTWYTISTSFLPLEADIEKDIEEEVVRSTAGLLLMQLSSRFFVCNPIRRTYFTLPHFPSIHLGMHVILILDYMKQDLKNPLIDNLKKKKKT